LAWTVEFDAEAAEEFKSLDRSVQRRLQDYIRDRIARAEDPRAFGRPLRGDKVGLWRYRVGNYRMICSIEEKAATVLVLRIGHRREVYKR
jgi:mRNA interferase RelE/StbE